MAEEERNEQERNELLQVRRDKMEALREKGVDPFGGKFERTHTARVVSCPSGNREKHRLPICRM
jgi:lysyl-tRNA synthetase class 2